MGTHAGPPHLHRGCASAERPRSGRHPRGAWDLAEGFDAEWRIIQLLTVEGDLVNRCEIFDEADLDAALARFDELSRPAPRLENAASRVDERFRRTSRPATGTRWPRCWPTTSPPTIVVGSSTPGSDAVGMPRSRTCGRSPTSGSRTSRRPSLRPAGERLALESHPLRRPRPAARVRSTPRCSTSSRSTPTSGSWHASCSTPTTSTPPSRNSTPDTSPAKRPTHAHTWSVIARAYAALNRHEIPATTPDWVNIDHRRGISVRAR